MNNIELSIKFSANVSSAFILIIIKIIVYLTGIVG
jgi:hypothetical protein